MLAFVIALAFLIQTPQAVHSPGGTVTGILRTSEGSPMAAVRVAVVPADGTDPGSVLQALTLTDMDGRFRIENVLPGRYHIMTGRIDSPLFHPGVDDIQRATTIVVTDGSTTQVADMLFVRTKISGRVIDAATGLGRRIESLSICCDYSPSGAFGLRTGSNLGLIEVSLAAIKARVNDDGSFEFVSATAGNHYFQVFDPNIVSFNLPITIADTDQTGIELFVSGGSEIRGKVVDQTSTPIGQASVSLTPQAGNHAFELRVRPLDGPVTMSGATLPSGASPLKPAVEDIQARLRSSAGTRMVSIGANGVFAVPGVLPGAYVLEINPPGGRSIKREIEVGSEASNIQIELPLTQITGKVVVTGNGTPPALKDLVRVFIYGPEGQVSFCLPGDDGRFYQALSPGTYHIDVQSLTSNYAVESISEGSRDLMDQPFILDRTSPPEFRVTMKIKPQESGE